MSHVTFIINRNCRFRERDPWNSQGYRMTLSTSFRSNRPKNAVTPKERKRATRDPGDLFSFQSFSKDGQRTPRRLCSVDNTLWLGSRKKPHRNTLRMYVCALQQIYHILNFNVISVIIVLLIGYSFGFFYFYFFIKKKYGLVGNYFFVIANKLVCWYRATKILDQPWTNPFSRVCVVLQSALYELPQYTMCPKIIELCLCL